jgi:hypothetical protein
LGRKLILLVGLDRLPSFMFLEANPDHISTAIFGCMTDQHGRGLKAAPQLYSRFMAHLPYSTLQDCFILEVGQARHHGKVLATRMRSICMEDLPNLEGLLAD